MKARAKAEQKIVDEWNKKYQIGQKVVVLRDSGKQEVTVTKSQAQLLSGHTAVIWLEGITGCYCLTRVAPVVEV
jgi:hypothetical protein